MLGPSLPSIARDTGISPSVLQSIRAGAPRIKTGTAARIMAASRLTGRVSANGYTWRLRSLIAMGHTTGRIASSLRVPQHVADRIVRGQAVRIDSDLARRITMLHSAWWDKRPPELTGPQRIAAQAARDRARTLGWPTAAGLDDEQIDTPGYRPASRWHNATGTGTAQAS